MWFLVLHSKVYLILAFSRERRMVRSAVEMDPLSYRKKLTLVAHIRNFYFFYYKQEKYLWEINDMKESLR